MLAQKKARRPWVSDGGLAWQAFGLFGRQVKPPAPACTRRHHQAQAARMPWSAFNGWFWLTRFIMDCLLVLEAPACQAKKKRLFAAAFRS
jgi:hypothetical protein